MSGLPFPWDEAADAVHEIGPPQDSRAPGWAPADPECRLAHDDAARGERRERCPICGGAGLISVVEGGGPA